MDWQVEQLRLTAFPENPLDIDLGQSWWKSITGREPDTSSIDRRTGIRSQAGAISAEDGSVGTLSIQIHPLRVDWRLTAAEIQIPKAWHCLGPYGPKKSQFDNMLTPWLETVDFDLKRIAFGCVLLSPVTSLAEGYRVLEPMLPFKVTGEVSDFLFQINRPRQSAIIEGLRLNRLTKWSVAREDLVVFNAGPQAPPLIEPTESQFAARLEMDLNTATEWKIPFNPTTALKLLKEFMGFADEIVADGDIS